MLSFDSYYTTSTIMNIHTHETKTGILKCFWSYYGLAVASPYVGMARKQDSGSNQCISIYTAISSPGICHLSKITVANFLVVVLAFSAVLQMYCHCTLVTLRGPRMSGYYNMTYVVVICSYVCHGTLMRVFLVEVFAIGYSLFYHLLIMYLIFVASCD